MNKTIKKVKEMEVATKRFFRQLLGRELKAGESVAIQIVPPGAEPLFDEEFQNWTTKFIKKYRSALASLAE